MSGDQDLLFFCAKASQSITNVSCPDHFLFLQLGITCFPVQDCEELTTFVPKSYTFTVHPSWSRRRMTCVEVSILKQSVINGTVGTGQCAAVLLGLPNLMRGQQQFFIWQEAKYITAAPDCTFGILSDNSVLVFSLPPRSQGPSFLFASTILLLSLRAP